MNTAWPAASTRLLGVLGWPVEHSLSPVIHNAALRSQGLDFVYLALPTPPERLQVVLDGLGAIGAVGMNVTVPHKEAVAGACDRLSEEAALVGAVNTLHWTGDGLVGHNTDAAGLGVALAGAGVTAETERAVLLGTGGAARAAAVALARLGLQVTVVGRRADAAAAVADVAAAAGANATACQLDEDVVAERVAEAGLCCNATTLGMQDEPLPEPFMQLNEGQIAYDLVYAPADTPFLQAARRAGAGAHGGITMLVQQAVLAYERWTGRDAPVDVMRGAAESALGQD